MLNAQQVAIYQCNSLPMLQTNNLHFKTINRQRSTDNQF